MSDYTISKIDQEIGMVIITGPNNEIIHLSLKEFDTKEKILTQISLMTSPPVQIQVSKELMNLVGKKFDINGRELN